MKQDFTKAALGYGADEYRRRLERDAFNLGMGDGSGLENAGLIAKNNAAQSLIDKLKSRKDKKRRLDDLILEQLRQSLAGINAEMDELDEKILTEQKAIQENNEDIDFIRTLKPKNVMGPDGKARDDVAALLNKHGYHDIYEMDEADIMLVVQTIETDLHNDNLLRDERVDGYQKRHEHLRDQAREIHRYAGNDTPDDIGRDLISTIAREPAQYDARTAMEAHSADHNQISEVAENAEVEHRVTTLSSDFVM